MSKYQGTRAEVESASAIRRKEIQKWAAADQANADALIGVPSGGFDDWIEDAIPPAVIGSNPDYFGPSTVESDWSDDDWTETEPVVVEPVVEATKATKSTSKRAATPK